MRITHFTLAALLLTTSAIAAGCDSSDSTAVPVATTVNLTVAADTLEVGQPNTSRAVALDQFGDTLSFLPTFSSTEPGVVGINPFTGTMLALHAGTTEIVATFGLKTARIVVTVLAPALRINEVKPNGEGPGGWVELFNPTDKPISVGGWKVTNASRASFFELGDGLVVQPHGFLTVEEADLPEGLKSVDEVHLFNRFGTEADSFSWPVNPVTSFGRCPEGTGPFITNVAPSKTRANVCPAAPAASVGISFHNQ